VLVGQRRWSSLDGAADALRPVFDLPDRRGLPVRVRVGVDRVRAALTDRPLRHSPEARALLDEATAFTATLHAPSKLGRGEGPEAI
jgi:hypothetical protein